MNMLSPPRERLVVIGNGMAGVRTVEEILARAPGRFAITLFGAEPLPNYNRILLSPVLAGEKRFEDIVTHDLSWYEREGIELIRGEKAVAIDRAARLVHGAAGTVRPYDRLLLATGSLPVMLPVPGCTLEGVVGFRSLADVETMLAAAATSRRAVVIGGGLLGLEAAWGLRRQGMEVTLLHLMPTLMERQLDAVAGGMLARDLAGRGIEIHTEAATAEILGAGRVRAVRLTNDAEIAADLVVMAPGIRANAALARESGLACNRGVLVDDAMHTSDPAIFAVGECVEHRGVCHGLVAPIWEMAKVAADHIAAVADTAFSPAATATRLKVTGIELFSAGDFLGGEGCEDVVLRDGSRGVYRRLVLREDRLVGILCYGDVRDGAWYFDLLRNATPLGDLRDGLIFGPAGAEPGAAAGPETLPDTAEICGCNGVAKGAILAAIAAKGLASLEAVRAHTKASASCGSCSGQVEALLKSALGDRFQAKTGEKPLCRCTDLGHDALRARIRKRDLRTIGEVMAELGWRSADGCASCRPALNFYLLCEFPESYADDAQSRFVNEREHANIQKDGTFSVVPRMWGGTTNAAELRAIADVVEKYAIPAVKVTGGQRLDLLGVKREQLGDVWSDLNRAGLVSGHAYGKALRTVKTCVGSEWCRFGVQDSTNMGIALEKMAWGSWHPHKVKLAVSGCPRNCAESTIKDFGVIALDSGWELHVGGNGGIRLRGTELLAKVTTSEEVLEYCAAFLQLYREEARYLERTAHWIERVGIGLVRARIAGDAPGRRALAARFREAQRLLQRDPWAEEAARRARVPA